MNMRYSWFLLSGLAIGCGSDNIIAGNNTAPSVEMTTDSPLTALREGSEVVFQAIISDRDDANDALKVDWFRNGVRVCEGGAESGVQVGRGRRRTSRTMNGWSHSWSSLLSEMTCSTCTWCA